MIYLTLSIICSTCLVLIFKLFERFKINTFQAIVVNYTVAAALGFILDDSGISIESITYQSWFLNALIMGVLFISLFYVIALTAQKIGIAVASVASKMSLLIPVVFAVYLYGDSMPVTKIAGIVLAIIGVYLTFRNGDKDISRHQTPKHKLIIPTTTVIPNEVRNPLIISRFLTPLRSVRNDSIFPIIVFIGSGLLDTLFKYTEQNYLSDNDMNMFISVLFAIAALSGIIVSIPLLIKARMNIQLKNIIGGIVLGISNYGSLLFLMKTLELENFESSVIFPVNNMGIVGLSAIAAFLFFKEKLTMTNWLGIAFSIIAIAMIAA